MKRLPAVCPKPPHEGEHFARRLLGMSEAVEKQRVRRSFEERQRGREAVLHEDAAAFVEAECLRCIGMHEEVAPLVGEIHVVSRRQVGAQPLEHGSEVYVHYHDAHYTPVRRRDGRSQTKRGAAFGIVRAAFMVDGDGPHVHAARRQRQRVEHIGELSFLLKVLVLDLGGAPAFTVEADAFQAITVA